MLKNSYSLRLFWPQTVDDHQAAAKEANHYRPTDVVSNQSKNYKRWPQIAIHALSFCTFWPDSSNTIEKTLL